MFMRLAAAALVAATPAFGEIFGDLRAGEKYVANAPLLLTCGTELVRGTTDSTGAYRLAAKGTGKCTLAVTHGGQSPSVDVVAFDRPARYRLVLEKRDTTWVLKRT